MLNLKNNTMNSFNSAQSAKILGLTENQFKNILRDLEVIEKDNTPKAQFVDNKFFSVDVKISENYQEIKRTFHLTWSISPTGLDYIHKLFLQHGVNVKPSIFV